MNRRAKPFEDSKGTDQRVDRRRFIHLAAAGLPAGLGAWWTAGCGSGTSPVSTASDAPAKAGSSAAAEDPAAIVVPKVNSGINIHPLRSLGSLSPADPTIDPRLIALQLRAVYELGFAAIRITAPFSDRASFLAAIPYVRAARALGLDVVVILSDFEGLALPQALYDAERRGRVLRLYDSVFAAAVPAVRPDVGGIGRGGAGRIALQILNEPASFNGIPPTDYVRDFLTPCFLDLKTVGSSAIVVAAAEASPARMRAMFEAGLERVTDRIAYHIYDRSLIAKLSDHVRSIIWVTESGVPETSAHLPWVRDTFAEIRANIADVTTIYYYDLYDTDPGRYRVIDIRAAGPGYETVIESGHLYDYWADRVRQFATGPVLSFDSLVPDLGKYLARPSDAAAYDEALQS